MMAPAMVSTRSFPMLEVMLFFCLASLLDADYIIEDIREGNEIAQRCIAHETIPPEEILKVISTGRNMLRGIAFNHYLHLFYLFRTRDLVSHIILAELSGHLDGCQVMLKEKFPSGLYLDPYQLASLQQHNMTEALISSIVDLEAPEYVSAGHTAFIFAKPDPVTCAECFRAEVPMHIRYHKPSGERENALVTLKKPRLLIRCSIDFVMENCREHLEVKAPCTVKNQTVCKWRNMKYKQVPEEMSLQVPVGIQQHTVIISSLTLLVTLLCSALLLVAVCRHGDFYI